MGSNMFDYAGSAEFWNSVPLRTVKRAIFKKGNTVRTLLKFVLNSVTYDFEETAQGGVVIVAPGFSNIEFISPDGRIDYNSYKTLTLGETLDDMEAVLTESPIPAWDRFAEFMGAQSDSLEGMMAQMASCTLSTIDGAISTPVNIPAFTGITNAVTFLEMLETAISPALSQPLSDYQLDTHAFGCALTMTSVADEEGNVTTMTMGFLFRE